MTTRKTTDRRETAARRMGASLRARLASHGRFLAVACLAVIVVALSGGALVVMLAAIVALCAAALLLPRRAPAAPRPAVDAPADAPVRRDDDPLSRLTARDLAVAVPDPIILFDANGAVVFANHRAVEAFGELPQGLLLALKFRLPEMQALIGDVARHGRGGAIDYAERLPMERLYRVAAMPIGPQAQLGALLFKDQSESRRIDRMRADFIANASHELRTPLASVSGFIETLRGPARNDEKARETFLQIMESQTARMARLLDDLLSLSRLEMKPLHKGDDKLDLGKLVLEVQQALAHLAQEKGVTIAVDFPDAPVEVPGSRDELTQIVQNLIENAVKYGHGGGRIDLSLRVRDESGRPEATLTVRDYGAGIAAEHIPRVTERFYRVDSDAANGQKGTGLGLAIVKHILTRHEGRLTIRSSPGKGAAFTVHLPME